MINRDLLKIEIDKVKIEYLEALYRIIKTFEQSMDKEERDILDQSISKETIQSDMQLSWHEFIKSTYGCLTDDPIERGKQGKYEFRERIE